MSTLPHLTVQCETLEMENKNLTEDVKKMQHEVCLEFIVLVPFGCIVGDYGLVCIHFSLLH